VSESPGGRIPESEGAANATVGRPQVPRSVREFLAAGAIFALGTALYLGPAMGWKLRDVLGPDQGDPLLYVYLLKWFAARLPHAFAGYWNPPFYFPLAGVLAYSDLLVGPGVAFALLRATGMPALATYNLLYLGTFAFAGLAAWWVLRRSGISWIGAALGGWFFAFGQFRWSDQSHFNLLRIGWIPVVLYSFDRLIAKPGRRRALAFLLCYLGQLAGGTYYAYLIHFPLAALVGNRWRELRATLRDPKRLRVLAATALGAVALGFAIYGGYLPRVAFLGAARTLREIREHSPDLRAFAAVSYGSPLTRWIPFLPTEAGRGSLFPGFVLLALTAWTLASGWRRYGARPTALTARRAWVAQGVSAIGAALVVVALLAEDSVTLAGVRRWRGFATHDYRGPLLVAALGAAAIVSSQKWRRDGTFVHWREIPAWPRGLLLAGTTSLALCLPMVFWLFWSTFPGMSGLRISSRLFPVVALAIGAAAGRGLDLIRERMPSSALRRSIATILCAAAALEQSTHVRPWEPLPDEPAFPAYARFLATSHDVTAYAQLPMYGDWRDLRSMYFGTLHWKPLVNGSTSFFPPGREALARDCQLSLANCLEKLSDWRVSHLVIENQAEAKHELGGESVGRRYRTWTLPKLDELERIGVLVPVFRGPEATVFRIDASSLGRFEVGGPPQTSPSTRLTIPSRKRPLTQRPRSRARRSRREAPAAPPSGSRSGSR
jgi:hypothetical protein